MVLTSKAHGKAGAPSSRGGFQICIWKGLILNAFYEYSYFKGSEDYGIKISALIALL